MLKNAKKSAFFLQKILVYQKFVVPLHPLLKKVVF